jgi:hypothetical protein
VQVQLVILELHSLNLLADLVALAVVHATVPHVMGVAVHWV